VVEAHESEQRSHLIITDKNGHTIRVAVEFFNSKLYKQPHETLRELRTECGGYDFTVRSKDGGKPVSGYFELLDAVLEEARKGVTIQRYKGLGEMNPEQLWETTMNPDNRMLKVVGLGDWQEADEVFTQLMGDKVEPRREFIERNALLVQELDI